MDGISFLIENGETLDGIQKLLEKGISLDEQVAALQSIIERRELQGDTDRLFVDVQDALHHLKPAENYSWNDQGAGKLFADVFQNECRYNVTAKEWFIFNGKFWEQDTGGMRTAQRAKVLADALLFYCTKIPDERQREGYTKFAGRFGRYHDRETMVKDARSEHFISQADLDRDGDLFNCTNGTYNLATGEFYPHRAKDLLSKISNVYYDPSARSPLFERFISDVMQGNESKVDYIRRILGYSLTTDTSLETCWILYGSTTRNGKSTLMETFGYMLGGAAGYALSTTPEVLAQRKNRDSRTASGDVARLDGARFLNVPEPPKKLLLDVALIKTWLGNDTIVARRLYQSEVEFQPVFKLFINCNHLPVVQDDTLFSSNRVNVISFDRHFTPEEQDRTLKDKLRSPENISGLFNWCLQGLRDFRESGAEPPESVKAATEDYRENSDKTALFFNECMEQTGNNSGAGAVYQRYSSWCSSNGFGVESKSSFFDILKSKGLYAASGTIGGRTVRNVVPGFEVIEDEPPLPEPPPYIRDVRGGIGEY